MTRSLRWACALLLAGAAVVMGAPPVSAAPSELLLPVGPAPSQVSGQGTSQAPSGLGGVPCLPVLGCDPLGGLGEDAARLMARAVFDAFATFVGDGVRTVLEQVSVAMTKTTEVKLDRSWFQQHVDVMRSLALLVLLPMMLIGLIMAVIRRDAGQLLRAGGVYVPVVVVGGGASIVLTERALQLTDWATTFVTGDIHGSTSRALAALTDAVRAASSRGLPGFGTFLAIVVLLVLMAGAVLIWIELLLRTGAIYLVVLFFPVAICGLVWRGTVSWTRRMVEVLVALIISKFVIAVVIDLAAGMITAGDGIGTIMQGATLLLLAACAPLALLRLLPMVEAGLIGHLERMERRPVAAATRAAGATTAAARLLISAGEAAAAGRSVEGNGGNSYAALSERREAGGQLNDVQVPDGWAESAHPSRTAAMVAGSADVRSPDAEPLIARRGTHPQPAQESAREAVGGS